MSNLYEPQAGLNDDQELPPNWHSNIFLSDEDYAHIYADDLSREPQENLEVGRDMGNNVIPESTQDWQQIPQEAQQSLSQAQASVNSTLPQPNTELTQHFMGLIEYLYTRQVIKNSLSKNNISNINPTEKQKILTLFYQLTEQLSEGHTILLDTQFTIEDYQRWQAMGWVTILPIHQPENNLIKPSIHTPLIVKILSNRQQRRAVVWLYRQWFAERQLAQQLLAMAKRQVTKLSVSINQTAKTIPNTRQQLAIEKASQNALCIITGGPGTGKTFTVAQLVMVLHTLHIQQRKHNPHLPPLSITLTAPTGKAAQRMQESLTKSLAQNIDTQTAAPITIENAKTLHRLLGIGNNGVPRYHRGNPLPDDLIIVDEASMLGLELASLLIDAIKPDARLILLGDANQLAAVDAGAVLSDLCLVPQLEPYHVALTESQRFGEHSAIGQLALAITKTAISPADQRKKVINILSLLPKIQFNNQQNTEASQKIKNNLSDIRFFEIYKNTNLRQVYDEFANLYQPFFALMQAWQASTPDVYEPNVRETLFTIFDKFRILSAGHHGNLGVKMINQMLTRKLKKQLKLPFSDSHFFHGQPIMMLKNDYQIGLFNGDIGICVQTVSLDSEGNSQLGEMLVCFPEKVVAINRISQDSYDTAFAFTIHKSQGSEFEHVAVCLDNIHTKLLSQELIYTAVTRSKQKLSLFCPERTLTTAILQKGNRQTGLVLQFD